MKAGKRRNCNAGFENKKTDRFGNIISASA
jgi:hypothetical protein